LTKSPLFELREPNDRDGRALDCSFKLATSISGGGFDPYKENLFSENNLFKYSYIRYLATIVIIRLPHIQGNFIFLGSLFS
jgi:hypothetical protein